MQRTIGLWGAVVTLVGFVIGAGIFLLPGELAASAGPGVIVAYAIASVIVAFACIVAAHIGATFPCSGASYVCVTRLIAPVAGFLMAWMTIAGVSMAMALVAHGFAEYFALVVPGLDRTLVAVLVVILFGAINMAGAAASVAAQSVMVVVFLTAIVGFAAVGLPRIDASLLTPLLPNGFGPVLQVAVPAFFSYAGFFVIIDLGGEIRNPARTIPLALLISFLVVWLCYSAVALVIVGHIPWTELGGNPAPVATVAAAIFPGWTSGIMTATVLATTATSINSLLLGYSRDVYVLARVRILPGLLAATSRRHGQPHYSVAFLTLTSIAAVLVGARIADYATAIVMALMLAQILLGISALRLTGARRPPRRPGAFQLGRPALVFFATGLVVFSTAFLLLGASGAPRSALLLLLLLLAGAGYYNGRQRWLHARGTDLDGVVRGHIEEQVAGAAAG